MDGLGVVRTKPRQAQGVRITKSRVPDFGPRASPAPLIPRFG